MSNLTVEKARKDSQEFIQVQVQHALTSAMGIYCITEALFEGAKTRNVPGTFSDTLLKARRKFVDKLTLEQCLKIHGTGKLPDEFRPEFISEKIWKMVKMDAEHRLELYAKVTRTVAIGMVTKLMEA